MPAIEETLYLGRYQQGQELPLLCQCTDVNGVPQDPTQLPGVKVYRDGATPTLIESRVLSPDLRGVEDGVFRLPLFLGGLYGTAGRYIGLFLWVDQASVVHQIPFCFTLNPGGSADGAVTAMTYVERPEARFLLYSTDAGRLVRGRNPR
jgi:hypothetical protein